MTPWLDASLSVHNLHDIEMFERTHLDAWRLPHNIFDAIETRSHHMPTAPAIRFLPNGDMPDREIVVTYEELVRDITRTANFLRSLGVAATDTVALLTPNIPQAQVCLWAAQTAGIACPINFMLEPVQIASIIRETECKVLIALGPHSDFDIWEKCEELGDCGLLSVVQVTLPEHTNAPRTKPDTKQPTQWRDLKVFPLELARNFPDDELSFDQPLKARSERIAAIFHTGGTTGHPKLVPQTHANQILNCWLQGVCMAMQPSHVRLCGLPLFHVNGALANGLALFMAGATLVLTGSKGYRDPGVLRNFWLLIQKYRANSFAAVPTFLVSLSQIPVADHDVSSLEFLRCGTAPLSRQLARDFKELIGTDIIEGYGLTEATSISAMNPRFGEKRIGSVGLRLPYHEVEIRKTVNENEEVSATNELGAVFLRGPSVIKGYLEESGPTNPFRPDGWYNTGDTGRLDEFGYLWLMGREKDIIIRGGHNLDPRMIEEAFSAHPAVANVAAIGRPDRYTGEMPIVYLTLKFGSSIDSESLLRFAGERIPERAAIPKQVRILKEMPLTSVGKIFKPPLRRRAAHEGYIDALGSMPDAYNLIVAVDDSTGETVMRLTSVNLSPTLHHAVRRFIDEALKTFAFRYEMTFIERLPKVS